MYQKLSNYIREIEQAKSDIPETRKEKLGGIADFIKVRRKSGDPGRLVFICTHNSRRSHFCRIWTTVLAEYVGVEHVQAFSGGTESTAFNPRAAAAVERAGFRVENPGGDNPRYKVYFDEDEDPLECYSKTFDDPANPSENFAAVMTCSQADENCPLVPGADLRLSIPYEDPKEADGTPHETETYDERCRQIADEMLYLISRAK